MKNGEVILRRGMKNTVENNGEDLTNQGKIYV
jgi:hypothetical protein